VIKRPTYLNRESKDGETTRDESPISQVKPKLRQMLQTSQSLIPTDPYSLKLACNYDFEAEIGKGAYGRVFRAFHKQT
jgi:hypothetical protein